MTKKEKLEAARSADPLITEGELGALDVSVSLDRAVGSLGISDDQMKSLRLFLEIQLVRYAVRYHVKGHVTLHGFVALDPIERRKSPGVQYDPDKMTVTKVSDEG